MRIMQVVCLPLLGVNYNTSCKQSFITSPLTNTLPFKIKPTRYLSEWPESMTCERVPVSKRCSGKACVPLGPAAIHSPRVAQQGGGMANPHPRSSPPRRYKQVRPLSRAHLAAPASRKRTSGARVSTMTRGCRRVEGGKQSMCGRGRGEGGGWRGRLVC